MWYQKLGHRAKSAENFVIIILNFDQNVCLDQALKVLCCSGERYRAIMALLSNYVFYYHTLEFNLTSGLFVYELNVLIRELIKGVGGFFMVTLVQFL